MRDSKWWGVLCNYDFVKELNGVRLWFEPFHTQSQLGDIKVILTSEPVDESLWCDHSNETSSAVLSRGTTKYFT